MGPCSGHTPAAFRSAAPQGCRILRIHGSARAPAGSVGVVAASSPSVQPCWGEHRILRRTGAAGALPSLVRSPQPYGNTEGWALGQGQQVNGWQGVAQAGRVCRKSGEVCLGVRGCCMHGSNLCSSPGGGECSPVDSQVMGVGGTASENLQGLAKVRQGEAGQGWGSKATRILPQGSGVLRQ